MLIHKTFSSLQFTYIRVLCIFMLGFETTQETGIACAYSLLPPPSTFTLNWAQFHRKLCLGSWGMLNSSKVNLTFWLCNETWKPRHFLLVSAFTGTVPCSSSPLRSARTLMKRRWNLVVEVSWAGEGERKSEILHYAELVLTDKLKCKSGLRFPAPGHKVKLLGFLSVS